MPAHAGWAVAELRRLISLFTTRKHTEKAMKAGNTESRFIEVNGFNVHYRIAGNGKQLIVLLHGSFLSLSTFPSKQPCQTRIMATANRRVVVFMVLVVVQRKLVTDHVNWFVKCQCGMSSGWQGKVPIHPLDTPPSYMLLIHPLDEPC